jgi:hypothetical protein
MEEHKSTKKKQNIRFVQNLELKLPGGKIV